ncbi:MAG: UDP-3-O-(3-hydroxymyristoyl)glucosamine N-acyltransferase [Planctomycetota bacterium]|nr:UDP-3-O-(3-hydroxymyristoyl)glucosamine N-acyltransferase [Planctomycetota bacterium]
MNNHSTTVSTLAQLLGAAVEGDGTVVIERIAGLKRAGAGEITFAVDPRRLHQLASCGAAAAVVSQAPPQRPEHMSLLIVKDVDEAMATLLEHFGGPADRPAPSIHPTAQVSPAANVAADAVVGAHAVVGPGAEIGPRTVLGPNVAVAAGARVGADCFLEAGVVVGADCKIGDRVRVGPNSVVGSEGFGYYTRGGVHRKFRHIGNVVIEDDVEIGACSCVDRAKFGSTRVGAGSKIDNLVQIAHNVQIGRGCLLCGQVGIAGSAELGDYVVAGGHAGIRDGVHLGDRVQCSAFAAVAADVPDGQFVVGIPAAPAKEMYRVLQAQMKLPELLKRVKELETRLAALDSPKND